jgi:cell wall-associated NlpC family hydrolase
LTLTVDQRKTVVEEAKSWLNTPYHPHGRVKGVGVDCAMLLAEVYGPSGAAVVPRIDPGYYSPQFGLHRSEEVFERFALDYAEPVLFAQAGDCVLFKYGRCFSHGGIMVSDTRLVHAVLVTRMVCYGDLSDAELAGREHRFYTVKG